MKRIALLSALLAPLAALEAEEGAAVLEPTSVAQTAPDCYCTNRGERVELGRTSCLSVGGRRFTARCAMSLNNPTWREMHEGCVADGLSLAPQAQPSSAPAASG